MLSLYQCFKSMQIMMLYDEDSGSQPFMGCGLLLKTVNTYGPLLINRVLQYHGRAI